MSTWSSKRRSRQTGRAAEQTPAQLTITELAMGGEGVGHLDGMAVFVPLTVPGDVVNVVLSPKGRFARGQLLGVVQPSPHRVASDCGLHPACGGCPWMEVPPAMALAAKQQVLSTTLAHVGKLDLSGVDVEAPIAAPSATGYRHRAKLHSERQGLHRVLGFIPARGRGVIPVDRCPVLEAPLERVLAPLARVLGRAPPGPLDVQLSGEPAAHGGKVGAVVEVGRRADPRAYRRLAGALVDAGLGAVEVVAGGRTLTSVGQPALRHAVAPGLAGGPYGHDAACFTQGNRAQNAALVNLVMRGLALDGGQHVLELHAGAGNFTLPVARAAGHVTSVESHPRAVQWARRNVAQAGVQQAVTCHQADADDVRGVLAVAQARRAQARRARVDAVLVDPPRTGAPALARVVAALKPQRVVYVSCNPATLARDLAALVAQGWELLRLTAVDLFPRTWHVEAVAVLVRRA